MSQSCPFCTLPADRIVHASQLSVVIRDGFPVANGHTLVVPRRHVGSFFEITDAERADILEMLQLAQMTLHNLLHPDGYNIGINDGAAAGQTVPHVHVHLIPRFNGDCTDPRGGVRWVVPAKADYWSKP